MVAIPKEILIWLLFTVVVSLIPLAFDYCGRIITTQTLPKNEDFFSDGQLLLIAVALGAEAMGGVLFTGEEYNQGEILIIGASFITTLCSAILYPFVLNARQQSSMKAPGFVVKATFILFFTSLVKSLLCKLISLPSEGS